MFEEKAAEARVRRKAKRVGLRLEKSRTRLTHINDHGLYQLIDGRNYIQGGIHFDASLAEIDFWLDEHLRLEGRLN